MVLLVHSFCVNGIISSDYRAVSLGNRVGLFTGQKRDFQKLRIEWIRIRQFGFCIEKEYLNFHKLSLVLKVTSKHLMLFYLHNQYH